MANYTGQELARAFRRVRGNTIQVAEDIPEDDYDFRATPDTRSVASTLVHIAVTPRMQEQIQRSGATDFARVDVVALFGEILSAEREPRTKIEIIELLQEEGERFASFLDGLSDESLDERVLTPGDPFRSKSRLELLMGVKEHEMHHRSQLMLIQRLLGIVPHLTRQRQKRFGGETTPAGSP